MLRRDAAGWLARLQSGREPDVEERFRSWYDRDRRHAEAFRRVHASYEKAALLRHSSMLASSGTNLPERAPARYLRPALAAFACLVLIGIAVIAGRGFALRGTEAVMLTTRTGEIRDAVLADGSRVTLDTASRIEAGIGASQRVARFDYGRARFRIARRGRPFELRAGTGVVSVAAGVVDVDRAGDSFVIEVISGGADLIAPGRRGSAISLRSGEAATLTATGANRSDGPAERGDWTKGMLEFDATPLAEAVALANRYSPRHIILAGDVAPLRVTGAFHAGDTIGFARALASAFGLSLREDEEGNLVLSPSPLIRGEKKRGG